MAVWYTGSTLWTAVTAWAASTAYNVGDLRRQLAAVSVNNERVFRCTTAGTSGGSEPAWTLTKGGTTTDNTAVWTEVTGNSTYGWTAPHARIISAMNWCADGDTVYISDAHAETRSGTMTLPTKGTAANPVLLICVDDSATPPTALATTATVTTTGSNAFVAISSGTYLYFYGITFTAESGGSGNGSLLFQESPYYLVFDTCTLHSGSTVGGADWTLGDTSNPRDQTIELINTKLKFGNVGQTIFVGGTVLMNGGSVDATGSAPTTLFTLNYPNTASKVYLHGVDLSHLGSGKNLFDVVANQVFHAQVVDCKLGASVAVTTGAIVSLATALVEVINCDSADTNYRFARQNYAATETHETTIVRTGGASDGTTTFSRKVVTTANSKLLFPYKSMWMEIWNDTIDSAKTITIETVTDNVTLTDAEAWLEVEALTTDGDVGPLGVFANDRIADPIFGTPANQTTSSETWTTTGLTTPVKQALAVTITPREKGLIRARVCVAKASTTVYYDPLITIS